MTTAEYRDLRVNDAVYFPDHHKPGKVWATQVLSINRRHKQITAFLHEPCSYRYPRRKPGQRGLSYGVWLTP